MIDEIQVHQISLGKQYSFSVLIPSWNNLPYLQLCIKSLKKNSSTSIQIIIFVNESKDGTLDWLQSQEGIDYLFAKQNIGICYGMNLCRSLVKSNYIIYLNDDMYVLPNWDRILYEAIEKLDTKMFMLSATMIEPRQTGNSCVVVKDYGQDIASFNERLLLNEYSELAFGDWSGSTWPPNVVHKDLWDLVGGLSIEFSPGMYSDPDFSRKLYEAGVRIFLGKGSSLVYHFGSKSTGRIKKNRGRKIFLLKWGITPKTFFKDFLKLGKPFEGPLENHQPRILLQLINKIKCKLNA